jgi:hypothetical protein
MAHTPGPWEYQNDTITSTHGDIARVHYQSSRDKKGWDDRPLMAAAPDLLAALKGAKDELIDLYERAYPNSEPINDTTAAIDLAIDAIAKAEGRTDEE